MILRDEKLKSSRAKSPEGASPLYGVEGFKWVFILILLAATFVLGSQVRAVSHDPNTAQGIQKPVRRQVRLPIKDFSLTDHEGRPLRIQSLKGKVVLVSFVYTTCPDICPLITSGMRLVQESLNPEERESVFLLSITTDPEIDTPQVLKSYAERYKVDFLNWSFITGDVQSLAPVWKVFGVKVERKGRGLVNHTSLTGLIDKNGVMRFAYFGASPDPKIMLQDLRTLLAPR
ncbi:MAG: SCO family protein [Deltaproteobacteria bacterium]|nr:SCO family protein [Deltaproteobacteria bacterium]